ncbi:MAG: 4-hydroxy-tetrahydrodipicolinate synthase [Candidatus Melainabacteria bacterium]|nr:4-hydroxy-tetrahydrodipicolinate synthase [Candidatus Melainabacteria bacterium]
MVTPFGDELEVDFKAVERLVDFLICSGTNSIVVAGTTGESPTLEDWEKKELLKIVLSSAKGRAKVIMGTGYNSTVKSIKASQEAESLGADGLLVVAPYYNKPSQGGLLAHFTAVAASTNLPVILYNIPGRTGINVNAETIIELSERCSTMHALKDSTGSTEQAAEIAGTAPLEFRIYSGDDYLTLPFLSIGACGVVSVASHLIGGALQDMIGAFFAGSIDKARQLHYNYLPLFKGLFAAPNPTCIKYALWRLGICAPHLRLPLVGLDKAQKEAMDGLLDIIKANIRMPLS